MPQAPHKFSFVHAADLHLDTPFHGIHEVAPKVASALREASLEAFDAIVELALARQSAFLVIAGDVYDGAERGLRAQLRFREGLARLSDAGIASFVVHGNHDPVESGWSAINSWPERVTIFGSSDVEVVPVEHDGAQIATVQGISYATPATTENLARRFVRPSDNGLHVGVLHCNVQGVATGYANYSPCTLEDLRSTGLDYLALGHIHQRRVLSGKAETGEPFVVYPGNSQARSPRASEREPKGAVVVHVRDNVIEEVEFVACDKVRFVDIECSTRDLADIGDLEDRLIEASLHQLQAAEGRSIIARAKVVGRSNLHADLVRPGTRDELLAHLRDVAPQSEPFIWWDDFVDATAVELDFDELRRRGDFAADLLGLAEAIAGDEHAMRAMVHAATGDAPRSLQQHLNALLGDDTNLFECLQKATAIAIDELMGEQR